LGFGNARKLQEQLVSEFECLHSLTNAYLDAYGRAMVYGLEAFKAVLDDSRNVIRTTRDKIVNLMVCIFYLDLDLLPPKEDVDRDVARILNDKLLIPSARKLCGKFLEAPASSVGTVTNEAMVYAMRDNKDARMR
jgi:hypothetical protein